MNCKKARGLILTDYLDDQMDEGRKELVRRHLDGCPRCKEFYEQAKKISAELFAKAERAEPSEFIWNKVREAIISRPQRQSWILPRPAIAFATILTLVLIFGAVTRLMINGQRISGLNGGEQIEYFDYSVQMPSDESATNETGFGTLVEKYFL